MIALDRLRAALERPSSDGQDGSAPDPCIADQAGSWSYGDLNRAVHRWIAQLDELGAARVAYRMPNGREWIALDLALLFSSRIAVPIPEFFSAEQEYHALVASGVDLYVSAEPRAIPGFEATEESGPWMFLRAHPEPLPTVHPGTAKITFTSGSTGQPKGVCLAAEQELATAAAVVDALGQGSLDRHLSVLPLSLLLENVIGVYANLLNGSSILAPDLVELGMHGSSGLNVASFTAGLADWRPHSLILVPQLLLTITLAAEFGVALPDSLRVAAVGGGKVPPALIERARRARIPVLEGYGLTECGSVVSLNLPDAQRAGTAGRPLSHVVLRTVDQEIHVDGSAMLGYLGEPAHVGPIATGDLGEIDADGFVHVLGRRKNCFITSYGRNVNPEWPESELLAEFPIAQALVFGEALPRNYALIVPRGPQTADQLQSAIDRANARLPDYARIDRWRAVEQAEFIEAGCLTSNGRARRSVASERFAVQLESLRAEIEEQANESVRATSV